MQDFCLIDHSEQQAARIMLKQENLNIINRLFWTCLKCRDRISWLCKRTWRYYGCFIRTRQNI